MPNERAASPESAEIGHAFRTEFGFQGWAYVGLVGLQVLLWVLPHPETWSWWQAALGTLSGLVCAVAVWALIDTGYRVAGGFLHLRMGPLRKRIALQSITGIRTEGPKLGTHFGLGRDLMQIDHVDGSVAVSPRDPAAFLAAIGHRHE